MATLAGGVWHTACQRQLANLCIRTRASGHATIRHNGARTASTSTTSTDRAQPPPPELVAGVSGDRKTHAFSQLSSLNAPHLDLKMIRPVPATSSYFSRVPALNDIHVRLIRLLQKYHSLPTVSPSEVPQLPWKRLPEIRAGLGEPIRAAYFSQVSRIARRLNLIERSLMPNEVQDALTFFLRTVDPMRNKTKVVEVDKFGRAVAAGRRKEASARAFVVEGTGEVLVNGKSLSEMFGRVHDRESAVWALTVTQRLDKYNVWALTEGGGTTGQAEAMTLALAKALVAHEPALKTALKKGEFASTYPGGPLTNTCSRLLNERRQDGGEEEARPQEGPQGSYLGQAIAVSSLDVFWFSSRAIFVPSSAQGGGRFHPMGASRCIVMRVDVRRASGHEACILYK